MKASEIQVLVAGVAPVVRDLIDKATAPLAAENKTLLARLDALEKRLDSAPVPKDGKDADPEAVAALVHGRIKAQLDAMQATVDAIEPAPELPELPDIPALIEEAMKAIPLPQDGASGKDGESVTVEDVLPALEKQVADFLAAIPAPQDGKDGVDGKDGAPGEKGDPGRDGLDVKDMLRADGGRLIAVMSDGTTRDLGVFVGKDGEPGKDGKHGQNGLGFEDLSFEIAETGRAVAKFQRGDKLKTIALPGIVDRGTFTDGEIYDRGDAVSWGGSLWIAQANGVKGKPEADKGWRLAVKRGRDGRDTEAKKVL